MNRDEIFEKVRSVLEEALGVRLVERTTRSVAITERGEQVLADARRLLKLEAEILELFPTLFAVEKYGAGASVRTQESQVFKGPALKKGKST